LLITIVTGFVVTVGLLEIAANNSIAAESSDTGVGAGISIFAVSIVTNFEPGVAVAQVLAQHSIAATGHPARASARIRINDITVIAIFALIQLPVSAPF
jgi:hypothetical protein